MDSVSCGVDEPRCMLSFDRSAKELAPCKEKDFSFEIVESGSGTSVAVFEIRKGGEVVRRNRSGTFPTNSLTKHKIDVNKQNCNVTLRKHDADIKLKDLFE